MAFNPFGVLKALLIKQEGTLTPTSLQITPGGTAGTQTNIVGAQTSTRTLTLPDATDTLTANAATQTLSNKTLGSTNTTTGVQMASFTPDGTHTLTAPAVTDTITANAASQSLTNKTFDSTSTATGIRIASFTPDGTHTLTAPATTDTLTTNSASQTLANKTLDNTTIEAIKDSNLSIENASDTSKIAKFDASAITASTTRTYTLPDANTTLVGTATTQTLTNKTLSGSSNTFTNIPLATAVSGNLPLGNLPSAVTWPSSGTVQEVTPSAHGVVISGAGATASVTTAGNAGEVLTSNGASADPTFQAAVFSASFNVTSQSANYSAVINDYVICSGASFTVTLPTAVGQSGKLITINHNGTNFSQVYTLNTTSAQTIGGTASGSYALYTNGETLEIMSDGANWQILDHRTETGWVDAGTSNPTATSGYVFTITSSSVTAGAVYTNNSQNFYVTLTIASSTTLTTSSTGAPLASGTLTKVSGTGPATIAYSAIVNNNPTKGSATIISDHNWWRRKGQMYEGRIDLVFTTNTSATTGTGDYLWWLQGSYNANLLIDTTLVTANGGAAWLSSKPTQISGYVGGGWSTATTNSPSGALGVMVYDSTKLRIAVIDMASNFSSGNACAVGSGHLNFTQDPQISVYYSVPIAGWQP